MQSITITVPNISCGHCVQTIKSELNELEGIASVDADQNSKQVAITWNEPLTWDIIRNLLEEINYPPAD